MDPSSPLQIQQPRKFFPKKPTMNHEPEHIKFAIILIISVLLLVVASWRRSCFGEQSIQKGTGPFTAGGRFLTHGCSGRRSATAHRKNSQHLIADFCFLLSAVMNTSDEVFFSAV